MKRSLPAYVYAKGKRNYLYFCRWGKTQRMYAAPGTAEFAAEYALLMRGRPPAPKRTIKGLIQKYMESERWPALAQNTKKSYRRHFGYLEEVAGHIDPVTLRTAHIYEMRDALRETPTDANRKIGTLSTLLAHGVRIGWLDRNPAEGVEKLKGLRPPREPWPEAKIGAFRERADGHTLLVFELCLGTGQRIGDVLKMRWSDIEGDGINVTQGKTRARLWVPFTPRLRAVLSATTKRGVTICAHGRGKPLSYRAAAQRIMAVRKEIGAENYDIHGLRYAAAAEMAAAGCSDELIAAVTGHTTVSMVRKYAGPARQKVRAIEAQERRK